MPSGHLFDLADLHAPLVAAPMAGGPSTPELAAAVSRCGGLGFVAGGYQSAETLREQFLRARELSLTKSASKPARLELEEAPRPTLGALGINLFVPGPTVIDEEALEDYAERLAPIASALGVTLELPRIGLDREHYDAKLQVVSELEPDVVSFTFGCPSPDVLSWLRAQGIHASVTVTTLAEAEMALAAGAASLTVQGPDAGGHRGTFNQQDRPADTPLSTLLGQIVPAARAVGADVVAAGGISSPAAVAGVLADGAVAAQLGTAFLLADEAGTHPLHRAAILRASREQSGAETAPTRVYSGRYGRAIVTDFSAAMDLFAPAGFPEIHHLVAPLRAAALATHTPEFACFWAGTGHDQAIAAPAARIMAATMPPELD